MKMEVEMKVGNLEDIYKKLEEASELFYQASMKLNECRSAMWRLEVELNQPPAGTDG